MRWGEIPALRFHGRQGSILTNFYQENHKQYFQDTVNIDPSGFLEPLAGRLTPGASILDVGCGSGRDLRWFKEHGFQPTGFEHSPGLAALARQHSGCPVIEGDFFTFDFSSISVSALVFVGSMVHVTRDDFPRVFERICKALEPGGYILITLKKGSGSRIADDGRVFVLWSKDELERIFTRQKLKVITFSESVSALRPDDIWMSFLLRQSHA